MPQWWTLRRGAGSPYPQSMATGSQQAVVAEEALEGERPDRAGHVLAALVAVAADANLNLAVANVALPDIGKAFDAGQTGLDLVAVGYSLGLAASVLYLGALGDRYGRKGMLLAGTALAIPASLVAGLAPTIGVLFVGRLAGGLAAGMAFPTTLALITALWAGAARTRAIALWSALGGGISALGPLISGALHPHARGSLSRPRRHRRGTDPGLLRGDHAWGPLTQVEVA